MSMNEHQSHITPISTEIDDEYIVLWWEGTDSRKTDSKELLKYLGFEASKDEFLDAINDVYNLREDPSKKLAVTFTNAPDSEIHPVTEVRIVDGKLNLIYTHDVNLRK